MGTAMLRITAQAPTGHATLRLEGRLSGPWVGELRRVAHDALVPSQGLTLDLSDVDFVDSDGAALLGELVAAGASLLGCSGFVFELLSGIPRGSSQTTAARGPAAPGRQP
jgi:ABC-type transporter Mla MlaB component